MSETIKEIAGVLKDALITPVQEAFVYRARNPFFGTLVIAWLFYNWNKIAYFILSKDEVLEKIKFIRQEFDSSFTHSFAYPFIWALFISLTYPFFTYGSIWIHKWITGHIEKINSIKEISRIRIQDELIIALHENESLKKDLQATSELNVEEKREKAARSRLNIDLLKEQKSTLESEIETLTVQKQSAQSTLSSVTIELESMNKNSDAVSDKYYKLINKYHGVENLRKEKNELGIKLNEAVNKLRESEANVSLLTKAQDEEIKSHQSIVKELSSEYGALKEELLHTKKENEDIKTKLDSLQIQESYSARIQADAYHNFKNKIEIIDKQLLGSINAQRHLTEDLDGLEDIAVRIFNDSNHHLVAGAQSLKHSSLEIYNDLMSVKSEVLKLIEKPTP